MFLISVLSLFIWGYDIDVLLMILNWMWCVLSGNFVGFMLLVYVVRMLIFGLSRFGFKILGVLELGLCDEKLVMMGVVCVLNWVLLKVMVVVGFFEFFIWVLMRLFLRVFIVVVGRIWLLVMRFFLLVVVLVRIIFILFVVWIIFFLVICGLLLWLYRMILFFMRLGLRDFVR